MEHFRNPDKKIEIGRSIPFVLVHLIALFGVFYVPFEWKWVLLCVSTYTIRMFGITAGYHRYFGHRSYKTSRIFQFLLAFLAQTSAQKGALWWGAHHRHHHKYSDALEDIHSPIRDGFWWSHCGWILSSQYDETQVDLIKDFTKYPELVFLNRYPHLATFTFGALVYAFWGIPGLIWGFFLSTVLLWHGTFVINSLTHVYGTRRYTTTDTSKNNLLFAIITMGEGWHNNHHCYQSSTNQGFFWWEWDPTYYILKLFSGLGIVWDLRLPPLETLESKRIDHGARDLMPYWNNDKLVTPR